MSGRNPVMPEPTTIDVPRAEARVCLPALAWGYIRHHCHPSPNLESSPLTTEKTANDNEHRLAAPARLGQNMEERKQGKFWEVRDTPFSVRESDDGIADKAAEQAAELVNARGAIFGV